MEKKYISNIVWCICLILVAACSKNTCREEAQVYGKRPEIQIVRLEKEIKELTDYSKASGFLNKYPLFSEKFLQRSLLPSDTILLEDMVKLATDSVVDTMYRNCEDTFKDLSWLQSDLSDFYHRVQFHFPKTKSPLVYTIVSGYGTDLFVKPEVIIIGLEYFLGNNSRYRPPMIPAYILRRLSKEHLVSSIGLFVGDGLIKNNELDNSMLQEMVKWGKLYYFLEKTLPCAPDSIIAGYTAQELKSITENEKSIWAHFVDQKLFFSNDHFLLKKYCDERPKVVEIGNDCPGRIGRWLGWKIVRKYAIDKNISLAQVMQEKDAQKIFNQANYRPD